MTRTHAATALLTAALVLPSSAVLVGTAGAAEAAPRSVQRMSCPTGTTYVIPKYMRLVHTGTQRIEPIYNADGVMLSDHQRFYDLQVRTLLGWQKVKRVTKNLCGSSGA